MRVGVVTGEVAVTIGATQQGMVAGDAVNTAARVQSAAAPGPGLGRRDHQALTTAAITYADVGSHAHEGQGRPRPAVGRARRGRRRRRARSAPTGSRRRWSGATASCGWSRSSSTTARSPGGRRCSSSTARPASASRGCGWEFEKYVDGVKPRVRWHSGRCIAYGEGVAYYALAEAVRGRLQVLRRPRTDPDDDAPTSSSNAGWTRYVAGRGGARLDARPARGPAGHRAAGTFGREDLFAAWTRSSTGSARASGDAGHRRRAARRRGAAELRRAPARRRGSSAASSCCSPGPGCSSHDRTCRRTVRRT